MTCEISKLLKYSPHKDSIFGNIKKGICFGTIEFPVLCPICCTVCVASLSSVIENYMVFQDLCPECLDYTKDTVTTVRI